MISYYTAIVYLSVFSMLIMTLGTESNSFMPIRQKRTFQLLFFLLILTNLAEWLATALNGAPSDMRIIHIAAKFIEFILAPAIPIACAEAIGGERNLRLMSVPIVMNFVLQVYSLFTGCVFTVNSQNIYIKGSLFYLYVFFIACGIILLIIHCYRFGQQYQSNNSIFMFMIILLVIGVIIMQLVFASNLRLDWSCASISAIMMYVYYDQLVQQVDDMTTLHNRRSYNCRIENFNEPAVILFFDVDNFKYANDTYGHSFGDKCLINISREIKRVFEKYGECYRFGGDEFCVIMTKNTENTKNLIRKYLNQIEILRAEESRLPSVSVGYVLFEPEKESIHEAIKRADKIMYQYKEKQHTEQAVIL